ncbi:MAG: hypothetical protein AABX33_08220 [Nanoarchaeota archaeon]|mgnify:CR=1 FL=1
MGKVGIFGDTGMIGQEIGKILKLHDLVETEFRQNSQRIEGNLGKCDIVFLATKEQESLRFAPEILAQGTRVVDLSGAYRLKNSSDFEKWYGIKHPNPELMQEAVYGLPAFYADTIKTARLVANPGCYPTSIILALKPLKGMLQGNVCIVSTSGISGARRDVEAESNERAYSAGKMHKHVPEIQFYSGFNMNFYPIVIESVFRGINTNIVAEISDKLKGLPDEQASMQLAARIKQAYKPEDLVTVTANQIGKYGTRDVNHTHKVVINVQVNDGAVHINSLIDNLLRGAASQAVENMNLMLGYSRLHGINRVCIPLPLLPC